MLCPFRIQALPFFLWQLGRHLGFLLSDWAALSPFQGPCLLSTPSLWAYDPDQRALERSDDLEGRAWQKATLRDVVS